jgi:hypothetical protein
MTGAGHGRNLIRALHWRRLDTPGSEYFTLSELLNGWEFSGTAAVTIDGEPLLVRYTVQCDPEWKTEDVDVMAESGGTIHRLRLGAAGGRWRSNEGSVGTLEGAVDVDLGVTPSTNTLPIRRLGLDIGEQADLVVAWIRFPDLSVLRSDQRYTRLAENTFRYESGSFSRDIEVDELGLVTSYPGLFVTESVVSG